MLLLFKISSLFFRRVGLVGRGGRQPSHHFVHVAEVTLSSLRAHRTPKTVVKRKFFRLPKQPSRHFVLVGRPKLW